MLSTQDFAQQVWLSLENIRERLAVLETEVQHVRCHLHRLESSVYDHVTGPGLDDRGENARHDNNNGASITIRLSRKALGGGSIVGGGILAVIAGAGKALGWW